MYIKTSLAFVRILYSYKSIAIYFNPNCIPIYYVLIYSKHMDIPAVYPVNEISCMHLYIIHWTNNIYSFY